MTRNEEINISEASTIVSIEFDSCHVKRGENGKEYCSRSSSHLIICIHSSLTKTRNIDLGMYRREDNC